ncbi:aspartate ammonia-lyase [Ornithinimicrobium sp. W1665]|uniref:aspartate ammonia-lyase n=1 Tax=Ornithinimicrobium sp. W1665 TaxID=3416666 RepID=UPI003CE91FBB
MTDRRFSTVSSRSSGPAADPPTRTDHDSLGPIEVPAEALWGAHTQRAIENFPISGIRIGRYRGLIHSLGCVKEAAAAANTELGLLKKPVGTAIIEAARDVAAGAWDDEFPVDVIQGGAGTSTNMNANEVIANAALRKMGHPLGRHDIVHPIEHVNKCQSTNDVYPTAVRLAIVLAIQKMVQELSSLADAFLERSEAFKDIQKIGRTQLQDAVPMTLGQEFAAFGNTIFEDCDRLEEAIPLLLECNLGATAIGTGITAHPRYQEVVIKHLRAVTALPIEPAIDLIEASWDTGVFMQVSGILKRSAIKLTKICNDLRLLSSGPQAGLQEILLPPRQAGSSIMPGKVNPVIPEMMNQVVFIVVAADLTVTLAAENGQLQLNAFEPVIAHTLLQAFELMENGVRILRQRCVEGISPNEKFLRSQEKTVTARATELVPTMGYKAAAALVEQSLITGRSIAELAEEQGLAQDVDPAERFRHGRGRF